MVKIGRRPIRGQKLVKKSFLTENERSDGGAGLISPPVQRLVAALVDATTTEHSLVFAGSVLSFDRGAYA